jgi:fucose permease
MLGTLLPSFNLTPEESGNIAFWQSMGLIIASIAVGPLIDSKGKKLALLLGLAMAVVALVFLPTAGSNEVRVWLMFLLGLGGGVIVTGANALAGDVDASRRAVSMNLTNVFFGVGGLLTPYIASLLPPDSVAVYLCYGVVALIGVTLLVHIATSMPAPSGERGFKFSEIGVVLSSPALYLLALFLFLYVACEVGVWNWLTKHLIAQGVPPDQALKILSLGFALGILLGRVVVSRLLVKIAPVNVTLGAAVLMAVTTYLALQTSDATVAWVAVFCAGLAMAPVFPTTLAMAADSFTKATATAMGIVITCGWIGLAVSSKIIGAIAGGDDKRLVTALLVLPAFSVVMIVVNLILRPVLAATRKA